MRKKNAGALFMDFEVSPEDRIGGSTKKRGRAKPLAKSKARKQAHDGVAQRGAFPPICSTICRHMFIPASFIGPGEKLAKPGRLCAPSSSPTTISVPNVTTGASFTGLTVTANVSCAYSPQASIALTVMEALPN